VQSIDRDADKPEGTTARAVSGSGTWATNGALIADVARLGYITDTDHVVDATYGRGLWWTCYRPAKLIAHDIRLDGIDFRNLPEATSSVDVVAFDPPYICVGGRTTTGLPDFHDRYGLTDAPTTPAGLEELIFAGLCETARIVRPGGVVLAKVTNYISSGRLQTTGLRLHTEADRAGLRTADLFIQTRPPRPQPAGRRQIHARANYSLLYVFTKAAGR
jgi:hypothetical protein